MTRVPLLPARGSDGKRTEGPARRQPGRVQAFNHVHKAHTFGVHAAIGDTEHLEFDALVVPGGVASGDFLRTVPAAVTFAQRMLSRGKPAAAICHGPWLLVEAGLVRGRTLTSWPSLKTALGGAGPTALNARRHTPRAFTPRFTANSDRRAQSRNSYRVCGKLFTSE